MNKQDIQKLRDLPIEGVAGRLGLTVERHKSLCPFHTDHHASLHFSKSRNTYKCFVCGAHGGTIDLVENYLHKDFREACQWLANEYNGIVSSVKFQVSGEGASENYDQKPSTFDASRYERYFEHPWLNDEARRFLFEERRLDPRVIAWCRITSWKDRQGIPWLQIPYYDQDGHLIGIQNRNLIKGCLPRFRFPQGSKCGIYNLPVLKRLQPGEALYIAEGCSDCWALLSAGHKAIAIPSATLLTKKDKELLATWNLKLETWNSKQQSCFHMYPDRDEPGERLFRQLKEVLPSLEHHQLPLGCKDFSDYYLTQKGKEAKDG